MDPFHLQRSAPARLVCVSTVCHQPAAEQPSAPAESRFSRPCATDEQPFGPRRIKVGPDWQPLETGWLTTAGMLVLLNDEGKFTQVQPTQEERDQVMSRVVEVGCLPSLYPEGAPPEVFAVLRPGESQQYEPCRLDRLRLRCRNGTARCILHLYPL